MFSYFTNIKEEKTFQTFGRTRQEFWICTLMATFDLYILINITLSLQMSHNGRWWYRGPKFSKCSMCSIYTSVLACYCVLLSSKPVGESKFSPRPGRLVEKLIDSGVAAIVTVAVLMAVRCHRISSQADGETMSTVQYTATWKQKQSRQWHVPGWEENR